MSSINPNQVDLYQPDSCFRSWGNFLNCYPNLGEVGNSLYYYGCKLLSFNNRFNLLKYLTTPENHILVPHFKEVVFWQSFENKICHHYNIISWTNLGSVAATVSQMALGSFIQLGKHAAHLPEGSELKRKLLAALGENNFIITKKFSKNPILSKINMVIVFLRTVFLGSPNQQSELKLATAQSRVLHEAATLGKINVLKAFLELGYYINQRDSLGNTALHLAAQWDQAVAALYLINKGIDHDARNHRGEHFIDCAIRGGHTAFVKEIIESGVRVDLQKAIMVAIQERRLDLISLLIKSGRVDVYKKVKELDQSPLEMAKKTNDPLILNLFEIEQTVKVSEKNTTTAVHFLSPTEL